MSEPSAPRALALDIGATKLAAAVVEGAGAMTGWITDATRVDEGPDAVVGRLLALGAEALAGGAVDAVGISCGGPLDARRGVLLGPLHLPGWDRVPIADLAAARFGVPARLLNDGSAGAWGEFRAGAGRGTGSLVHLTVSSGLGGGAVVGGRLLAGAAGNGGEPGHVVVRRDGRRCVCGRLGCAEAYVAGVQLAARAREAVAAGEPTALADVRHPSARDVLRLADGDPVAGRIWADAVDALAAVVVDLVNVLEPELVVLGGGVASAAGERLLGPVRAAIDSEAMPAVRRVVRVGRAALGDAAPAIGAGLFALDRWEEAA